MWLYAAHYMYMKGSTYVKEQGDTGASSSSTSIHLCMSSRTHRRTVVMDSCTLFPSSEVLSIYLKANTVLSLLKQKKEWQRWINSGDESKAIRCVYFLTHVKALMVRFKNAYSTSSGILSIWAMQSSMHDNVCLGAWKGIKPEVKVCI